MSAAAPAVVRRDDRLVTVVLAFVTILVYARALGNGFINFDDTQYVTDNPRIQQGLTLDNIAWAFKAVIIANYHPVTLLSHMLDVSMFGLSPAGHHFVSIALHTVNVALLFLLLRRMTGREWRSAIVAALFAVHPLHVESVAWVAERKDVLSMFFALLALHVYIIYARKPGSGKRGHPEFPGHASQEVDGQQRKSWMSPFLAYVLMLVAFALGLLSKAMLVTLPAAMLLLDYWPLQRLGPRETWWPRVREKLPLVAMSIMVAALTVIAQRAGGAVRTLEAYPLHRRAANALVSTCAYVWKTVWPTDLSIFYPYPRTFSPAAIAAATAVLVAVSVAAVALRRSRPYLFVGWFWFLGTLVPVIGLVQVGRQAMADRYTYLPHIGLFIAIVWALADAVQLVKMPRNVVAMGTAVALLGLAILTIAQLGYWQNSTTLFEHALSIDPTNYLANHQLANELARGERPDLPAAEHHYRAALASFPEHPRSHLNLGRVLARRGRWREAEYEVSEALRLDPSLPTAAQTLAEIQRRLRAASGPATRPASSTFSGPPSPL